MTEVISDQYCQIEAKSPVHFADAAIDFVGGVAGGTASVVVGQPLDTVKVKLQTFPSSYSGMSHCFHHTLKTEGIIHGLYAGSLPSLAAQVSENAMLFAAYGVCQKGVSYIVNKDVSNLSAFHNALAGSFAAFFSSLTLCPTELIKCRLQTMEQVKMSSGPSNFTVTSTNKKIGPLCLTRQILREEGVIGMFRGFVPTVWREMPGYFFFFGGYEFMRHFLTPKGSNKNDLGQFQTFVCGATGGVMLWLAVYPFDVIKSRSQIQSGPRSSIYSTTVTILRHEGMSAMYKGLLPTLLRTIPATGALFLAYENVKKILSNSVYR